MICFPSKPNLTRLLKLDEKFWTPNLIVPGLSDRSVTGPQICLFVNFLFDAGTPDAGCHASLSSFSYFDLYGITKDEINNNNKKTCISKWNQASPPPPFALTSRIFWYTMKSEILEWCPHPGALDNGNSFLCQLSGVKGISYNWCLGGRSKEWCWMSCKVQD